MIHFLNFRQKNTLYEKSGVTLVELMVAFGVFGIFISIALGGFMQALKTQRIALVLMETNDSASIIFENVARQLRTAKVNDNAYPITIQQDFLSFYNYHGQLVEFDFTSSNPNRIISNIIQVDAFNVQRINSATTGAPPRLVMSIRMKITDPSIGDPIYKTLQTTISPRLYYNLKDIQI
jgi:type II secretory pathway pseudopilin PulG